MSLTSTLSDRLALHRGAGGEREPRPRPASGGRSRAKTTSLVPDHREWMRRELVAHAVRIDLAGVVRSHGTPLFVLEPARITAQIDEVRRELPGVEPHVALKSLPHPAVIRAVDAAGASFDVASRGELDLLDGEGVDVSRCLHTHPVKTVADLTCAVLRGVRTFVVDSVGEVAKFAGLPDDVGVLVRLSFPNSAAASDLSSKFGVPPAQAAAIVETCMAAGLRVRGFSFHVGSQTTDAAPWRRAIEQTLRLMRTLEHRHGIRFEMLDIGGGFPVAYDRPVPPLGAIARGIRSALAGAPRHLRVVAEPGRFVTAPAMTLVTRVIGTNDRADGRWHYLDDGVYGAYSNIPAEGVRALVFTGAEVGLQSGGSGGLERVDCLAVTLAGPTCDAADVIARQVSLPRLADGDLVVSPMMGAYTWATATTFNGIPRTQVVVVPDPVGA